VSAEVCVALEREADVAVARREVRAFAAATGFSTPDQAVLALAVEELARNILDHAQRGRLTLARAEQPGHSGIRIVAHDRGPGIAGRELAVRRDQSRGGGLPGVRAVMDELELVSTPGLGTTVTMTKWLPSATRRRGGGAERSDRPALGPAYVAALEAYLRTGDEVALGHATVLGRRAVSEGHDALDLAQLHRAAIDELVVAGPPAAQPQLARAAADFFAELLAPLEMSSRVARAASADLERLDDSLRQQDAAVAQVNRELESFTYSVTHDLRAPLRRLDTFSQLLLERCTHALGGDGQHYVRRVRQSAQHMARLIDDLLALASVSRSELRRLDVNLTALARRVVDGLRVASPARDTKVVIDDDLYDRGDARLLAVALENLLGNAWKFTSKRTAAEIRFGREQRDGRPIYFVRDNGAGFDMACSQRLFAPFERLHPASEFEGTGVGLATVQRVVHRHDGRVWADGKIDQGATIYFTLGERPLLAPADPA